MTDSEKQLDLFGRLLENINQIQRGSPAKSGFGLPFGLALGAKDSLFLEGADPQFSARTVDPQLKILQGLKDSAPTPIEILAKESGLGLSTFLEQIDRLKTSGLIRQVEGDDGVGYLLTTSGNKLLQIYANGEL